MPEYIIDGISYTRVRKYKLSRYTLISSNNEIYEGKLICSTDEEDTERVLIERINKLWNTNYSTFLDLVFHSRRKTFASAIKALINGIRDSYTYKIINVSRKDSLSEITLTRDENTTEYGVINLSLSDKEIIKEKGLHFDNLVGYSFESKRNDYHRAWHEHIYGYISSSEIEDKVILPALVNIGVPNLDHFSFDKLDKYFNKMVFEEKELVKIKDKYYDSTKWVSRLQSKIPDVRLEAILDENYSGVKPKGTSYWYINVSKEGTNHLALMNFGHNFVHWIH